MASMQSAAPSDLMLKYKRQTYLLAFPVGMAITMLFAIFVAEKNFQFYIAVCMTVELGLLVLLLLFLPHILSLVDLIFYFSYPTYFFIVTQANLNNAILDGSFSSHLLSESVNSMSMWSIVFMVGAYLVLNPRHVKVLIGYIFLVVIIMAIDNLWLLYSRGMLEFGILFSWVNPIASMSMATLLIQRMGVLQQKRANTDALTGLLNRHALYRTLAQEVDRSARYGNLFSVILFDLDHFKKVNDTFGHLAGDNILKGVSDLAGSEIRHVDCLGRWGGEEFLIILPETDVAEAHALAERIRLKVEQTRFIEKYNITASFSVTTYGTGQSVEALIECADIALYQAKDHGRNQVFVFQQEF